MKRIATAVVLIPLVVWLILAGPWWTFVAALVVVGLFALREVVQIGKNAFVSAIRRSGLYRRRVGVRLLSARGESTLAAVRVSVVLGRRYGGALYREEFREAEAGSGDQSEQDMGRRRRVGRGRDARRAQSTRIT